MASEINIKYSSSQQNLCSHLSLIYFSSNITMITLHELPDASIWFIPFLLCPSGFSPRMSYLCPSFLLKITSKAQHSTHSPFQSFMESSQTTLAENESQVLQPLWVLSSHNVPDIFFDFFMCIYSALDRKILESITYAE